MVTWKEIKQPELEQGLIPVLLSDETMQKRKEEILKRMKQEQIDAILVYADMEHGSNFEYLVGFVPRFEEALLVLHSTGEAYLVLGNENLNKAKNARLQVKPVHMPHFSLPRQPMNTSKSVSELLKETKIDNVNKLGLVGWKYFTSSCEQNSTLFDLPNFLVEAIKQLCTGKIVNATSLFIGENGARLYNNANEFTHYEFGAALAGNCILQAMDKVDEGISEMEIGQCLDAYGQYHNVVTIMTAGERFIKANMYPTDRRIKRGDSISMTTGFKGGLQSRAGFAISSPEELPDSQKDYLDKMVYPYYKAVTKWLEGVHIGIQGRVIYELIEACLPKKTYGWRLCPGHLCADEEWLTSPIYENSTEVITSGMLFQIDIIPSRDGYHGISCESGIFLADEKLRHEIQEEYPQVWKRIERRRQFMKQELGIQINEEVLPTSIATAYCRPFLLHKKAALTNI